MKKTALIIASILTTFCISSCQHHADKQQDVAVINLAALAAIPSPFPIDTLAKGNSFIDVTLPEDGKIDQLSGKQLANLKAAAYRFYKFVQMNDGHYIVNKDSVKNLQISEKAIQQYILAIDDMNHFVDSMKKEGQLIQLPEVNDTYRNTLLK